MVHLKYELLQTVYNAFQGYIYIISNLLKLNYRESTTKEES